MSQDATRRFIIVVHGWHVDSNGFDVHEVEAADKAAAEDKGHALAGKRQRTFDKTAFTVIEIGQDETQAQPPARRLSWAERITGTLDRDRTA